MAIYVSRAELAAKGIDAKEVDGPASSVNGANVVFDGTDGKKVKALTPATHIADLAISAVTGVDGTANNAASKTDVDTAFASIVTKMNAIFDALEASKIVAAS